MKTIYIYSIFGDCEAAAAEVFIKEGIAARIPFQEIPISVRTNQLGQVARFAVKIPRRAVSDFEELIANLRA